MKTLTKTIALGIVATALTSVSALAVDATTRGPLPFSSFDLNKDGSISNDELTQIRAKYKAAHAADGRQLQKVATAPAFGDVDTDKNGKISKTEFASAQAKHHRKGNGAIGWEWE